MLEPTPKDARTPGMRAALTALAARRGAPTEHDVPPPRPFPGRRPKIIEGQLGVGETPDGEKGATS